jgi:SAM-dependent methyltransferase
VARQLGVVATYLVADARYLPFSSGSFDIFFSYSVFQHFDKKDVRLALAEGARILRPSGTSLIQMPNIFGVRNLINQGRSIFTKPGDFQVRYWRPSELEDSTRELIGPTSLAVDGYFGLGVQASDMDLLPFYYRFVVACSEVLRKASERIPWMKYWADSLYVRSIRV